MREIQGHVQAVGPLSTLLASDRSPRESEFDSYYTVEEMAAKSAY